MNSSQFGHLDTDSQYSSFFNGLMLSEVRSSNIEPAPFKTEFYSIILCIAGYGRKKIGPHTFDVSQYSVHITRPEKSQIFFDVSSDFKSFVINLSPSFYLDSPTSSTIIEQLLIMNPKLPPIFKISDDNLDMISQCFININTEYQLNCTFSKQIILNQIIELLYRINRLCTETPALPDSAFSRKEQLVRAYKRMIDQHFSTYKTVKEYADLLNVSAKYLGEAVKFETGQTALPMIHYRIIQEARHLLKYTTHTIKEISFLLNFENITQFSRFFKKHSGSTPSDFRKKDSIVSTYLS